jgi:hypothetical protein
MSAAAQPPSDAVLAQELATIVDRLAALASGDSDGRAIGQELAAIRAQLRLLAADNAEVEARLGHLLGLRPAD